MATTLIICAMMFIYTGSFSYSYARAIINNFTLSQVPSHKADSLDSVLQIIFITFPVIVLAVGIKMCIFNNCDDISKIYIYILIESLNLCRSWDCVIAINKYYSTCLL